MTVEPGQRIATGSGAMLLAPALAAAGSTEDLFDPEHWRAAGRLLPTDRGRGSAWFIAVNGDQWVLRHFRRGGLVAPHLLGDRYVWHGESQVRAFAEWRLLAQLRLLGLPVPEPLGARYRRSALTYRCDLIMRRIADARPLSSVLRERALAPAGWRDLGRTLRQLHAAGCDHADLNAHNVLVGPADAVSIIDFDRGRLRGPGAWSAANLERLRRSLRKLAAAGPEQHYGDGDWQQLLAGYGGAG